MDNSLVINSQQSGGSKRNFYKVEAKMMTASASDKTKGAATCMRRRRAQEERVARISFY